jgi:hypothetical protein
VHLQALTRHIRLEQHIHQQTRFIKAKNHGSPPLPVQTHRQRNKCTLGAADIQVGYHECNRNGLVGPSARRFSSSGQPFIETLLHGTGTPRGRVLAANWFFDEAD